MQGNYALLKQNSAKKYKIVGIFWKSCQSYKINYTLTIWPGKPSLFFWKNAGVYPGKNLTVCSHKFVNTHL